MLPKLPPHPLCVRGPPTTIFASAYDVAPPSLVEPSLENTDFSDTTAAMTASVALLVKSVNFIILTLVVLYLYSAVRQQ